MTILGELMKRITCLILFLTACIASADDEKLPWTFGGLDWSSDGRYIAVGTSRGAHIHNSDDLSLFAVLGDGYVDSVAWSNRGLKLAFNDDAKNQIVIQDLEYGDKTFLTYPPRSGDQEYFLKSIVWSPADKSIAAGEGAGRIFVWEVESRRLYTKINFLYLYEVGWTQIDWRPGGLDIISGSIMNGIAVWNHFTGILVDFIFNRLGGNRPARWSPDGNMIAAGRDPVTIWKVKPDVPNDAWAEIGGERIQRLDYEAGQLHGLSWHPDSTKLAFIVNHFDDTGQDFSRDGALIWDRSLDSTLLVPGVFIVDMTHTDKVIEWSPDGNKLAAISSDGRIVTWDAHTFDIVAEYAGYRSILDFYKDNL